MTYKEQADEYGNMPANSSSEDAGMSMRAHFAAAALAPIIQRYFQGMQEHFPEGQDVELPKFHMFAACDEYIDIANMAWAVADAMLDCAPESELKR